MSEQIVRSTPTPSGDGVISRRCRLLGHSPLIVQTDQVVSFMGGDHWSWPGVVSLCRRCGLVFRAAGPAPKNPFTDWKPIPHKLRPS